MENTFKKVNREFTKQFKTNMENRAINHGHVNKIKQQMIKSLNVMPPITINETTNHVIDGQHRLEAFIKLVDSNEIPNDSEISVMFVRIPEYEEKEAIVNANTNSKNWSLDDYIASFKKCNNEYRLLDEWCSKHTLCIDDSGKKRKYRYGAAMLKGVNCSQILKDGSFKLTPEDIIRGELIHSELLEIVGVLDKPNKGSFYEAMAISWAERRDLHSFKDWLKEIKNKKNVLAKKQFTTKSDWNYIFDTVNTSILIKK